MSTYVVRSGDTLGAVASKFHTSVSTLAKTNHIANVNVIFVGQKLTVPDQFKPAPAATLPAVTLKRGAEGPNVKKVQAALVRLRTMSQGQMNTGPGTFGPRTETALKKFQSAHKLPATGAYNAATRAAMEKALKSAPPLPPKPKPPTNPGGGINASNGTPMYRQGDPRWGGRRLGTSSSLAAAGCAMTATAMAISKISGNPINPGQLDQYLDTHRGYVGNGLIWDTAARARGLNAAKSSFRLSTIDANLKAGKPVVIGVDYKPGSNGGSNGTDHWITIVARTKDSRGRVMYVANDPATGTKVNLFPSGGILRSSSGGIRPYKTTGELVVFSK